MKAYLEKFLHDKTIFISGASSGIGFALAEICLQNNSFVIAAGRSHKKLQKLKKSGGKNFLPVVGDISQDAFYNLLEQSIKKSGRKVDLVVHCAGVSFRGNSLQTQAKVYQYIMNVNFISAARLFTLFYPALLKTKGTFSAVVSMQGLFAIPRRAPYVAAKHALRGFLNAVRREAQGQDIHVMGIYPGYVASAGSAAALTEDGKTYGKMDAHRENGLPPQKVAEAIVHGLYFQKKNIYAAGFKEKLGWYVDRFFPNLLDEFFWKK